jgi:hypothetical protein
MFIQLYHAFKVVRRPRLRAPRVARAEVSISVRFRPDERKLIILYCIVVCDHPNTAPLIMSQTLRLYPLSNFTFSTKEAQPEEDPSVAARLQRLQNNYEDFGMRRTAEGVLVVHVSSRSAARE